MIISEIKIKSSLMIQQIKNKNDFANWLRQCHTSGGLMARPISGEEEDLKRIDLLPRIHITADLSKEKVHEDAANPRHGGTISPTLLIRQKACQSLIEHIF